jgi:hypothetical protein
MCEPAVAVDPYEEFGAALTRFIARTRNAECAPAGVADALIRKQRFIDVLRLDLARDAAHFADTDEWERQGSTTPITWLTNTCHMTPGDAAAAVCVGDHADALGCSLEAMDAGSVGFAHVVLLARTAEALAESGAQLDEPRLLRRAEAQSPNQFRRDCAHARHAADAAAFQRRQQQCADERFLEVRPLGGDDGGVWLKGFIDAAGGATLRAALEPLARRHGADDDRSRSRRLADALVEMSAYTLNTGGQGTTHCQVPHLQVTTTLETLIGAPGAPGGEVEGCVPISTAMVQRLACSANVRRILLGPESLVVDVGRARRVPATSTRIQVEQRDRGCVWPRCRREVRWTEVHHLIQWARGGATEADKLVLLCHRHHDDVHLRGWQIVRVAGQRDVLVIPPVPLVVHASADRPSARSRKPAEHPDPRPSWLRAAPTHQDAGGASPPTHSFTVRSGNTACISSRPPSASTYRLSVDRERPRRTWSKLTAPWATSGGTVMLR